MTEFMRKKKRTMLIDRGQGDGEFRSECVMLLHDSLLAFLLCLPDHLLQTHSFDSTSLKRFTKRKSNALSAEHFRESQSVTHGLPF